MRSDLFDCDHYRHQTGLDLADAAAWQHFRTLGDAAGLDPSPYFATGWYKARYPHWARQGAETALADFLARTRKGHDRQPHPLIDPVAYRARYPDLADLGAGAGQHFMRHGDAEGRSPSPGFDAAFYARCYLPLGESRPFRHYVTTGAALGCLPCPVAQDFGASQQAMAGVAGGRVILLAAHDAQAAGVPILTLDLGRALRSQGWTPVFLLRQAGPLLSKFQSLGPVFVLPEGWDLAGLAAGLPKGTAAILNTAAAASLAVPLARAGMNCHVLVHEMAAYIREQGLLADLQQARAVGAGLVASMPVTARDLAPELGPMAVIVPGITLPPTPLSAFRLMRRWRADGAGPVFIGAGHADRRKGFDLFLSAASRIAVAQPQARFVWLGALDPWAKGLADQALARGLCLTLPGFVADSLAWYRAADGYLLTSRQDPGPTTVIHAAATGTPFVGYAADIGIIGMADHVGRFVPAGDEAGFVSAALDLTAATGPADRRRQRRLVRAETGFDAYVAAILSQVATGPAAAT